MNEKLDINVDAFVEELNKCLTDPWISQNPAKEIYEQARTLLNQKELFQKTLFLVAVEGIIGILVFQSATNSEALAPIVVEIMTGVIDVVLFIFSVLVLLDSHSHINEATADLNKYLSKFNFKPLSNRQLVWLSKQILSPERSIPEKYRKQKKVDEKPKRDRRLRLTEDGELEEVGDEEEARQMRNS